MKTLTKKQLLSHQPCSKGLRWLRPYRSLKRAWLECNRGDWMWWALEKSGLCSKELSAAYVHDCAKRVKRYADNATRSLTPTTFDRCAPDVAEAAFFAIEVTDIASIMPYGTNASLLAAEAANITVRAARASARVRAASIGAVPCLLVFSAETRERKTQADFLRSAINPFLNGGVSNRNATKNKK